MPEDIPVPHWIAPGAKVAVRASREWAYTVRTVERLTPTLVILADNGGRFRRAGLREPSGHAYTADRTLTPLTDPDYLACVAAHRLDATIKNLAKVAISERVRHEVPDVAKMRAALADVDRAITTAEKAAEALQEDRARRRPTVG